jgi:hypothetical protein
LSLEAVAVVDIWVAVAQVDTLLISVAILSQ